MTNAANGMQAADMTSTMLRPLFRPSMPVNLRAQGNRRGALPSYL
jgi:hypothetical protein